MPDSPEVAAVRSLLDRALADRIGSAAVLFVQDLRADRLLLRHVAGSTSHDPPGTAIDGAARFDLASVTKLITATVALRLSARGALDLDAPVADLLGERLTSGHAGVTPRHLLAHTSGLPAWGSLWERGPVLEVALATPVEADPGARHLYSDIGYLWLGAALEAAGGAPLDALAWREVLGPLGMPRTRYHRLPLPADDPLRADVVATERCPERGLLVGEVSDRNTWHLGGVAPHAGLFGPAGDLVRFAQGWWDAPRRGFLPASLRDEAWGPAPIPGGHVLGWDTVNPDPGAYTSAGRALSPRSHGHLAFTGPSVWVDPDRAVAVVLLLNRVHPSREETRHKALRPAVHDAVARAVDSMS